MARPRRQVTEALVLRVVPYGETSQVAHLATAPLGLVAALAKGARRTGPEFQGGLALGTIGEAHLSSSPASELWLLHRFRQCRDLRALGRDLERFYAGCYVLDLLRAWMRPALPGPDLYEAGTRALGAIATCARSALPRWVIWFEARAVAAAGHRPLLEACAACGRPAGQGVFSPPAGGLAHADCAPSGPGRRAGPAAVAALRRVHAVGPPPAAAEPLDRGVLAEVRAAHDLWIPYVLERRPASLRSVPRP